MAIGVNAHKQEVRKKGIRQEAFRHVETSEIGMQETGESVGCSMGWELGIGRTRGAARLFVALMRP